MNRILFLLPLTFVAVALAALGQVRSQAPAIQRRIPPEGIALTSDLVEPLAAKLQQLQRRLQDRQSPYRADVDALLKAVDLALLHGEFYSPQELARARQVLDLAERRIAELEQLKGTEKPSWLAARNLVVRGYYSRIDDSPQPYGLEIPAELKLDAPVPLYVWLHGRGDKTTDLHFIAQRLGRRGRIQPPEAIVLHPFGRHCIGFKSAGEIDVLEAVEHVKSQYPIDADRIVLMGFSMGGAGCWHVGAHYADRWVAMSPGAGFAETAQYNRLAKEQYPAGYEQTLWGLYDVPNYVRNLFNLPVVAYSGENDKQIQAARVMEAAYAAEGRTLPHLIGPKMGHQYHPETLAEIMQRMAAAAKQGRPQRPHTLTLQTRTLRYPKMHWVRLLRLEEHWQDTRVDVDQGKITTKNVAALALTGPAEGQERIELDGQPFVLAGDRETLLSRRDGKWTSSPPDAGLAKRPGQQGPIDDVFLEPFLVVLPSGTARHPQVQQWVDFEVEHFRQRWQALFRGRLRIKRDTEVTPEDLAMYHVILWGDPQSNRLIARVLKDLPLDWSADQLKIGTRTYNPQHCVPVLIYPNPVSPAKYVVLNSGPTFREAHDRTNSLQNPKLPDWAVLDLRTPPTGEAAGKVLAADFFDESWQVKD